MTDPTTVPCAGCDKVRYCTLVKRCLGREAEASRIAQDLAYMAARNSGEIERRQIAATSAMETQLSMWRCKGGM